VKKVKKSLTPNTGHQYERLCSIIRRIQKGAQSNNRILAEEYRVGPRTIQRDMDFLRDRWALPLEYDPNRYTWFSPSL
jgi:predicted DNA-binding transcriptional regulator YafY